MPLGKPREAATITLMDIDTLRRTGSPGSLEGQMLIAMPNMPDERFSGTVIYICAHNEDGAMGIVVNRQARNVGFADLLVQLDIVAKNDAIRLPRDIGQKLVMAGGPVEPARGFVLHSTDFILPDATRSIAPDLGLTVTLDILRAIARGEGPKSSLLALGYAGWGSGQLEREILENSWLHGPADTSLILGADHESKYARALATLGIDKAFLSQESGHG